MNFRQDEEVSIKPRICKSYFNTRSLLRELLFLYNYALTSEENIDKTTFGFPLINM